MKHRDVAAALDDRIEEICLREPLLLAMRAHCAIVTCRPALVGDGSLQEISYPPGKQRWKRLASARSRHVLKDHRLLGSAVLLRRIWLFDWMTAFANAVVSTLRIDL